ncbi:MAG: T9SS type A sorting domain-containing protein [Flavobacteriales bacterium]|nr:T9SS type A sorting domain-containing protein [Flavobacteriales bacterium]
MKRILLPLFIFISTIAFGQVKLKRTSNSTLRIYAQNHPNWNESQKKYKWGRKDTLNLPFFDDFVSTKVYPDSGKWFNNYVYINNDFPVNPPSYGVATFDDLDAKGRPYTELSSTSFGACDTLLSLAINLQDSNGVQFTPADSIYFSFYFQRQGLGDPSDDKVDSLIVQFKDKDGFWKTVWKARGGVVAPFEFVMFDIKDSKYLHKGFQFRFINYSRHTGNMNQWHVDYVHLAKNRRKLNHSYNDFAIQGRPTSLLKKYSEMPYAHFLTNPAEFEADTIFIYASNLSSNVLNIEARQEENFKGNTLVSTTFSSNAANIPAMGNAKRRFPKYSLSGLSGKIISVEREFELRESGISSKYVPNDKIKDCQLFGSCYAYDDGSAEYGFGYDDDVPDPFLQGAIAYKFDIAQSDTLTAIGMFFNRSVTTSAAFSFDLKVWQSITKVKSGRLDDVSLYTGYNALPKFTDSINGFHVFYLDTPLVLPKGAFYIGWEQQGTNHLDVGYDINNGYHQMEASDNLYFVDRNNWVQVNDFKGALMMRPYFGKKPYLGDRAFLPRLQEVKVSIFPNPVVSVLNISSEEPVEKTILIDQNGRKVLISHDTELQVTDLKPGVYTIQILLRSGKIYHQKIVKL